MKFISALLILITAFFNLKHGFGILTLKPGEPNMINNFGIGRPVQIVLGVLTVLSGLMVLFLQTFLIGNIINALLLLSILLLQLKVGNTKAALIEIPFLLMPLIMLWLGYPVALLKYLFR